MPFTLVSSCGLYVMSRVSRRIIYLKPNVWSSGEVLFYGLSTGSDKRFLRIYFNINLWYMFPSDQAAKLEEKFADIVGVLLELLLAYKVLSLLTNYVCRR